MDNRTEPLAEGVWRVEVGAMVNAFVLADDGHGDASGLTLVDPGSRSAAPRLVRSIRVLGFDPRAVGRVLLTHWHRAHAGGAARFAASSAAPSVSIGAADLDVLTGRIPRPHACAPPGHVTTLGRLAERAGVLRPPEAVPDATALADGERLEVADGLLVVAAPGHTPGHSAFWLPQRGVLLAGDAVFNTWVPWRGPRALCSALPDLAATQRRLARLDPGVLAVGHGPPLVRGAAARLRRLAERAGA